MNESFPRIQDLIQSVQRQMQTMIQRKDVYNMQIWQDWNTFRWSRITLLNDSAAKLITMKVHVFSDSQLCVGVSIQIHRIMEQQNWRILGTNMDLVDKLNLTAREVQFFLHVVPGASTLHIKKHLQRYLNGRNHIPVRTGSYSCQWLTTSSGQRKAKSICTMPKKWLEPASAITWWNGNPNKPQAQRDCIALQVVHTFKCHTSIQYFQRLDNWWGRNYHLQGTNKNKKILINTTLAGNLQCIYACICQWYDTEHLVPTPRKSEEEEDIDLDPEQLTTSTQEERNMPQARSDSLPDSAHDHIGKQLTLCLHSKMPVVWSRTLGTSTVKIGRGRTTQEVNINYAKKKKTENATSSRRLVATTHWESRDADSQSFRTGSTCQHGGNWTLLYYQWILVLLPTKEELGACPDLSNVVPPWCLTYLEVGHERMLRGVDAYERVARDTLVEPCTDPIIQRSSTDSMCASSRNWIEENKDQDDTGRTENEPKVLPNARCCPGNRRDSLADWTPFAWRCDGQEHQRPCDTLKRVSPTWPQWMLIIVFIAYASDNPWLNGSVWNQCAPVMSPWMDVRFRDRGLKKMSVLGCAAHAVQWLYFAIDQRTRSA